MPSISLTFCPLCHGRAMRAMVTPDDDVTAGTIQPCECGSGVEAITEDGEVLAVGKLPHHGKPQEPPTTAE